MFCLQNWKEVFHAMHIVFGEIIISTYGLLSRVHWDLEKELTMNKTQQNKTKTHPYSDLAYC